MKANIICVDCCKKKAMGYLAEEGFPSDKREEAKAKLEELVKHGETLSAPEVMAEILEMISEYRDTREMFGDIKDIYNDILLSVEDEMVEEIRHDEDPILAGIQFAITGNYIDAIAVDDVQEEKLRELLAARKNIKFDPVELQNLKDELASAKKLVYIVDNAGEVVLDKFFVRVLRELYPDLEIGVMVRGEFVLNDATEEDAIAIGFDKIAPIIPNGTNVPGTPIDRICPEAREWIDTADLIIAKGQGNFETMFGSGVNAYYLFLCKCHMFVDKFQVPSLTPMLKNELRTVM